MDHDSEIPNARLDLIMAALSEGKLPKYFKNTAKWALELQGRKRIDLVTMQGPTPEGTFVYDFLGQTMPTTVEFDQQQTPYTKGRGQYIKDRNGKEHQIRKLEADGRTWKNTTFGNQWAKVPHAEIIVYIPILVRGESSNGDEYEREEYLSMTYPDVKGLEQIALDTHMTDAQKDSALIQSVKDQMGIATGEEKFLREGPSGQRYYYDPTREHQWRVSKMITRPSDQGPSVFTSLRTPMSAISSTLIDTSIPYVDQVLEVSFERHDDHMCVCRGVAAITKMTVEEVAQSFDFLLGNTRWRQVGLTPIQVEGWCMDSRRPYYCVFKNPHGRWQVKSSTHADPQGRSIAFCAHENHCYMYRDAHSIARMVDEEPLDQPITHSLRLDLDVEPIIQADNEDQVNTSPEVKEWTPWDGEIRPGNYYSDNLQLVRQELLQKGRAHQVVYNRFKKEANDNVFSLLSLKCIEQVDGAKGTCYVRHLNKEHQKIQRWLDCIRESTGIHVKWHGQGLPNLTLCVFKRVLKSVRSVLTKAQKLAIMEKQNYVCAMCKQAEIEEFDHTKPLSSTYRGEIQMFRGLCMPCHVECTKFESDKVLIRSSLSPYGCEAYMQSARAPNIQFVNKVEQQVKDLSLQCVDIKRCRWSAVRHYDDTYFPVFCVLDNIKERVEPILGDLNYIEVKDKQRLAESDEHPCVLTELPLYGSGWYPKIVAAHALNHHIVTWEDIKLTYTATGRIPRESVEMALDIIEQAWEGNEDMAKESWNSCVGCMATEFAVQQKVQTSMSDIPALGTKYSEFHYTDMDGKPMKVYDHITNIPTLSCLTYRPIWDCILGWEHVKVSVMLIKIDNMSASVPKRTNILEIQTDAILVKKKRKRDDITPIYSTTYEEACKCSDRQLFPQCRYPVRTGDQGIIYHKKEPKEMTRRRFNKIRRHVKVSPMIKQWNDLTDVFVDGKISDEFFRFVLAGTRWLRQNHSVPGYC